MFPRAERLRAKRAFETLFARGSWNRGNFFRLIATPAKAGKIGFIVSKKTAKLAVDRNRLKRRARATFRQVSRQADAKELFAGYNIAVNVNRQAAEASFVDLIAEARKLILGLKK